MSPSSIVLAAILGLTLAASAAEAASFDCGKAKTTDEIAICRTPLLSELDVQMSTLYAVRMQLPMLMGSRGAAQDEQRAFLKSRATCAADTTCLQQSYLNRIAVLNQTIQVALNDYCIKLGICG